MHTTLEKFPACKLATARAELAKSYAKLARSAQRAGQQAPEAPVLTVTREYLESKCRDHGRTWEGTGPCPAQRPFTGPCLVTRVTLMDLELVAPRPILAGWEFLAVIEPLPTGNLIRKVPSAEVADGELERWRTGALACDHCGTTRRRSETFIVRGSDGAYKQVGRQCLTAFTGGESAAAILCAIGWPEMLRAIGDGEGGGEGAADPVYVPEEFLAWCAAASRLDGFVTRTAARAQEKRATSDIIAFLLGPEPSHAQLRQEWKVGRERLAPTESDVQRGKDALAWARTRDGRSDYEYNLGLVAALEVVSDGKHLGLLASAIAAYERALGETSKRAGRAPSTHVGTPGDKVEITATVERAIPFGDFGQSIVTYRDDDGRAYVWRTAALHGQVGAKVRIAGKVKAHSEFRGELQTELTRCKVMP